MPADFAAVGPIVGVAVTVTAAAAAPTAICGLGKLFSAVVGHGITGLVMT